MRAVAEEVWRIENVELAGAGISRAGTIDGAQRCAFDQSLFADAEVTSEDLEIHFAIGTFPDGVEELHGKAGRNRGRRGGRTILHRPRMSDAREPGHGSGGGEADGSLGKIPAGN